MKSSQIRKEFLHFFKEKNHQIVSSSPIVVKDDPTLMFTNAQKKMDLELLEFVCP